MKNMNMSSKAPGSGKAVHHSKSTAAWAPGSVRMPAQQAPARINVPRDHKCVVCPGSNRMK
jgi:hypothetical protein